MVDIQRIPLHHTLTFKVTIALVLFFMLNSVALVLWDQADLMQELEIEIQTAYRHTAVDIAEELEPFMTDSQKVSVFIDSIAMNYPGMELFLVSRHGQILEQGSYVPSTLISKTVPIDILESFIEADTSDYPIEIPIPTATDLEFVFSSARLGSSLDPDGYILVTLLEGGADEQISWWDEYGLLLVRAVVFSLFISIVAGIMFWYFLTRRIDHVAHAVQSYRSGENGVKLNKNGSDEIAHVASHVGDMMDRIDSMFDELGKKEKMRTELLASVSHELQTPLTVMQGNIETLVEHREKMSDADLTHKLGTVYSQVRRMSTLIDDMFDVAILETGQMRINPEPFPMVELVESVIEDYSMLIEQSKLTLERGFSTDIQTVIADPLRIRQVIRNLLSNAVKYSQPGGKLKLCTRVNANETLTFSIEDTGIGIAEAELENVFRSFYRSSQPVADTVKGTGLGLHICQEILKLHETKLRVKSRLDVGSTFSFDLRLYKEVVTI